MMRAAPLKALLLPALLCGGCLEPGRPVLAKLDSTPPSVVSTQPADDPSGISELPLGSDLEVVFSEQMDPRSIIPGIGLLREREELPISPQVPNLDPPTLNDVDVPYRVTIASGMLEVGTVYTLVLRTLLIDAQGNPLPAERLIQFRVRP